jgi:hypothetical protein
MKISSIIGAGLSLINLLLSLFVLWLTLGWRVRKARKAFEKQLIRQGMAKKDAKKLSAQYAKLKDDMMNALKRSVVRNL